MYQPRFQFTSTSSFKENLGALPRFPGDGFELSLLLVKSPLSWEVSSSHPPLDAFQTCGFPSNPFGGLPLGFGFGLALFWLPFGVFGDPEEAD